MHTSQLFFLRPRGAPAWDGEGVRARGAGQVREAVRDHVHAAVRVERLHLHHQLGPPLNGRGLKVKVDRVVPDGAYAFGAIRGLRVPIRGAL